MSNALISDTIKFWYKSALNKLNKLGNNHKVKICCDDFVPKKYGFSFLRPGAFLWGLDFKTS